MYRETNDRAVRVDHIPIAFRTVSIAGLRSISYDKEATVGATLLLLGVTTENVLWLYGDLKLAADCMDEQVSR